MSSDEWEELIPGDEYQSDIEEFPTPLIQLPKVFKRPGFDSRHTD